MAKSSLNNKGLEIMTEKETREEFKKLVIMGNHLECDTYDEALEKELGFGCNLLIEDENNEFNIQLHKGGCFVLSKNRFGRNIVKIISLCACFGNDCTAAKDVICRIVKIIGLPITIGRVLKGLPCLYSVSPYGDILDDSYPMGKAFCSWKLTADTGQEATDDDQEIETITALLRVLKGAK